MRRFVNVWRCNICRVSADKDTPSYYCTLCDYDLCVKCATKFIKEGKAKQLSHL